MPNLQHWDAEDYQGGRNFGHLAFEVDNIYETCRKLMDPGVVINRPLCDGRMAFICSPDKISIEFCKKVRRWHLRNRGFLWKIRGLGKNHSQGIKGDWLVGRPFMIGLS